MFIVRIMVEVVEVVEVCFNRFDSSCCLDLFDGGTETARSGVKI